ncbi:receptor-interacting serine/threonine-protein kinase 1-like, partial [Scleropages formosus]
PEGSSWRNIWKHLEKHISQEDPRERLSPRFAFPFARRRRQDPGGSGPAHMAAPGSPSVHMRSEELIRRAELEHGSFGRVHLCYHKTLGQVVLKTMYTGPQRNGENKRLLLEEGTVMHNLNHERIVKLHGVILESGAYSLVIEVIPKDNLLTVRERRADFTDVLFLFFQTLPISIKGRIILEILEGMFYLTKNNVIHRDLKPENILVDKDFHIKLLNALETVCVDLRWNITYVCLYVCHLGQIADLGLASCQTWSRLTMEESRKQSRRGGVVPIVGSSLCYLAPEHLENIHAHSTEKSDVYSFAIIVWVILTGKEPYENARNQDHICQCVCKGNRPDEQLILPDTPSDIVRLMRKCWHPQPEMRPTFADCSAPLWRNIGLPVEASTEDMTFYLAGETEGSIEADANVINFKPGLKPQPGQACHNPINSISPPLWNPGRNSAGDDRNIVQRVGSAQAMSPLHSRLSNHVVREEHLHVLRNNIGGKWKQCARRLGLSENDVETIAHDFARDGLQEMVHQMLERWRMKEGLAGTTMASLCRALRDLIKEDVLLQLLQICGNLSSL